MHDGKFLVGGPTGPPTLTGPPHCGVCGGGSYATDSVTNCSIGSGVVENVRVAFGITLISQFSAEIGNAKKCDFQI